MPATRDFLDQQVNDLRDRMRLLQQDRRANVDLLEANKTSNSDEIRSLREDNKKLRLKVTQLQKRFSMEKGGQHELITFQREAVQLRTDYDSLKVISNRHQEQIGKLQDEARICELEARKPRQADGPLSKKIRMLENKLDNALIKYNEAQSIRSTYEHIVKRLKEERLSFNNQLTALERTLKAKKRDYDELLLLSGDASHAREAAQHELQQARAAYEEKRSRRAGEMRERQQVVKIRRQMLEKQERRDAKKKELLEQQMEKLKREAANDAGQHPYSMLHDKEREEEQEQKLSLYEEVFRKIKEVTGVSEVDKVIEKVQGQKTSTINLQKLSKENSLRIEQLKKEKQSLLKIVEEKKFSGGTINATRKTINDNEELLVARYVENVALSLTTGLFVDIKNTQFHDFSASSTCGLDRAKKKYEHMSSILMGAKSGVKHLQQSLSSIGQDIDIEKENFDDTDPSTILWSAGNILVEVMAKLRECEMDDLYDINTSGAIAQNESMNSSSEYEVELQESRPFNQRIQLPSAKENLVDNESSSEVFNDVNEDELCRERVKKASSSLIRAQLKKNGNNDR